jgi:hypothetical protein
MLLPPHSSQFDITGEGGKSCHYDNMPISVCNVDVRVLKELLLRKAINLLSEKQKYHNRTLQFGFFVKFERKTSDAAVVHVTRESCILKFLRHFSVLQFFITTFYYMLDLIILFLLYITINYFVLQKWGNDFWGPLSWS